MDGERPGCHLPRASPPWRVVVDHDIVIKSMGFGSGPPGFHPKLAARDVCDRCRDSGSTSVAWRVTVSAPHGYGEI